MYDIRSVFEKTERIIDLLKIFAHLLMKAAIKFSQLKDKEINQELDNNDTYKIKIISHLETVEDELHVRKV